MWNWLVLAVFSFLFFCRIYKVFHQETIDSQHIFASLTAERTRFIESCKFCFQYFSTSPLCHTKSAFSNYNCTQTLFCKENWHWPWSSFRSIFYLWISSTECNAACIWVGMHMCALSIMLSYAGLVDPDGVGQRDAKERWALTPLIVM